MCVCNAQTTCLEIVSRTQEAHLRERSALLRIDMTAMVTSTLRICGERKQTKQIRRSEAAEMFVQQPQALLWLLNDGSGAFGICSSPSNPPTVMVFKRRPGLGFFFEVCTEVIVSNTYSLESWSRPRPVFDSGHDMTLFGLVRPKRNEPDKLFCLLEQMRFVLGEYSSFKL